MTVERDPFMEYVRQGEPRKKEKAHAWSTAIGLQAVDGLKPSKYLVDIAIQNIEGEINLEEAKELVDSYYISNPMCNHEDRVEEADKVATRIAEILSENAFTFTPNQYMDIHKRLFSEIYSHAGNARSYNITKKEWVLDGETVIYGNATQLIETLEYDIRLEREFSYKGMKMEAIINHMAKFLSNIWQIHIFEEGNTRTTAVFFIKYIRTLGFDVDNESFSRNAWYFRNALVRANYTNLQKGIHETTEYLVQFLRNLLLNENKELHSRNLHVKGGFEIIKPDIEEGKPDIEIIKPDICSKESDVKYENLSRKTINNVERLSEQLKDKDIFGRNEVMEILQLKKSSASELLQKMLTLEIIEPVRGYGKGRYRFTR